MIIFLLVVRTVALAVVFVLLFLLLVGNGTTMLTPGLQAYTTGFHILWQIIAILAVEVVVSYFQHKYFPVRGS